jgi:excisionase family DNA binding protein
MEGLLTAEQVADLLQTRRSYVLYLMRAGELPGLKISPRVVRFKREDLDEFIKRRESD